VKNEYKRKTLQQVGNASN